MATTHAVAPRLTTFLRAARGLDDVVDVDAERARRNETLRTTTRRDATTDDTPSVRLARRVLRCEDGREAKDVVKTCRAFVSVVVRMLGSDTMTETASGDAAASAWDAASGFVEVIANERRAVESERGYVADHETARKIFEVREREVRKDMMEALRGALGPVEANAPTVREFESLVEDLLRMRGEFDEFHTLKSTLDAEPTTSGRIFGQNIKFKRAGDAQPSDRIRDLKRAMKTNLSEASEAERLRIESERMAHPDERMSGFGEPEHVESDATTQLTWLKRQCEGFVANSAHALDQTWEAVAGTVGRAIMNASSSDDECAAELYEYLGDYGFELIAGVVERRTVLTSAIKNRAQLLRDALNAQSGADRAGPSITRVVTITSTLDKQLEKARRKEERKANRKLASGSGASIMEWLQAVGVGFDALCEGDWENQQAPSSSSNPDDILAGLRGLGRGMDGGRKALPPGTTRIVHPEGYEEISVPAREPHPVAAGERSVAIEELDEWAQPAFQGIRMLNRIQSKIFPQAYHTNENLLVCAPTGAGKTNIAMLTVLHEIGLHIDENGDYLPEDFKIVYVAPMKALAAEVTDAFSRRLAPLDIVVAELTGDTQMSKRELEETQMIVTTPEKWDVITRKGGEVSVASTLRLLIIDEVHLLNDERGPVIETLVARTLRQVEQTQSMIRIVGLSATLPNPVDVARFLGVNNDAGLFVFDQSYRPIPLTQKFIGVTEKNSMKRQTLMAQIAYNKACEALRNGKQAMVFVHSRKDTVKTAKQLAEFAAAQDGMELFSNDQHERKAEFAQQVSRSRNNELKDLFLKGLGCHNAGMLRADRSLTEKLFAAGLIKVLVCTATLAWGVNLPAHMVVIKGTQLYDPQRGGFRNLGVLDVQQIFGRAGRPGFTLRARVSSSPSTKIWRITCPCSRIRHRLNHNL